MTAGETQATGHRPGRVLLDRVSGLARLEPRQADRLALAVLAAMMAAFFVVIFTLALLRYLNFRDSGVDTAIFDQVVWLFSRFRAPYSTIRGMTIFGDHMNPVLALLAPVYWLRAGVPGLLGVQTAVLASGAVPLYLVAKSRLSGRVIPLVVAGAYLLYPALQHVGLFDFHPEALAVGFLLFAFLAIERGRTGWFYLMCALAVLCKEDMALAVLLMGLLAFLRYDRRAGKVVMIASGAWFLLAVLLFIPLFGPEGFQYTGRLSAFGDSPLEVVRNLLFNPGRVLGVLATRANLRYLFDLLVPTAFMGLLAPLMLLPALPAVAVNLVSDFPGQQTIFYQYTVAIIPFVFMAVVVGLDRLRQWLEGAKRARAVMAAAGGLLVLSALAGSFYLGPGPLGETWNMAKYRGDAHIEVIREGVDLVPPGASVSSQVYLLPHLSERQEIYMFPNPFIDLVDDRYYRSLDPGERRFMWPGGVYRRREPGYDPLSHPVPEVDYVALARGVSPWPLEEEQYLKMVDRLLEEGSFDPVYDREGVLILRRKGLN